MPIPPLYYVLGAAIIGKFIHNKMNQRQQSKEPTATTYTPLPEETAPEPPTIVKPPPPTSEPADFTTIAGIGATYAQRLQDAGIHTFADLAQLEAENLQQIVSPKQPNRAKNAQAWIDEAKQRIS